MKTAIFGRDLYAGERMEGIRSFRCSYIHCNSWYCLHIEISVIRCRVAVALHFPFRHIFSRLVELHWILLRNFALTWAVVLHWILLRNWCSRPVSWTSVKNQRKWSKITKNHPQIVKLPSKIIEHRWKNTNSLKIVDSRRKYSKHRENQTKTKP